ncbi:MAG: hypothetical protein PHS41_02920 [Victivallaceae bacterium]|nr:hypothetical protein [Victivallaceae bacterium]
MAENTRQTPVEPNGAVEPDSADKTSVEPIGKELQLALDEVERRAQPDWPDWRRGGGCAIVTAAVLCLPLTLLTIFCAKVSWIAALGGGLALTAAAALLCAFRPPKRER